MKFFSFFFFLLSFAKMKTCLFNHRQIHPSGFLVLFYFQFSLQIEKWNCSASSASSSDCSGELGESPPCTLYPGTIRISLINTLEIIN